MFVVKKRRKYSKMNLRDLNDMVQTNKAASTLVCFTVESWMSIVVKITFSANDMANVSIELQS